MTVQEASTDARGVETRAALISAGRELFARRGFDGTSVRDITREAEANLGSVTYHFGSKRGLYESVLEAGLTPLVDRVAGAAESHGTGLERIVSVVDVFFDELAVRPEIPRLLLQEVAAGKTPPAPVVNILKRNAANLGRIIAEGQADGTIRPGNTFLSALSVASQPIYITVMAPLMKEVAGVDLTNPATRRTVADHVKAFVRAGLGSPEESHS
jgi:AcrR family transcriptional regulator